MDHVDLVQLARWNSYWKRGRVGVACPPVSSGENVAAFHLQRFPKGRGELHTKHNIGRQRIDSIEIVQSQLIKVKVRGELEVIG